MSQPNFLKFQTIKNFRYNLALSILSGKPIRISKIRIKNLENPGLQEYEANLLKLIDLITNGTNIEINPSGTSIAFIPGILQGGDFTKTQNFEIFETNCDRGLSYYLEFLFMVGMFCKEKLKIKLKGVTNGHRIDPSVDIFKASGVDCLKKFIGLADEDHLYLHLEKRSIGPESNNGIIELSFPNPNKLKTIQENFIGKIAKIRGNAYSCRVPPQLATRVGKVVRNSFSEYFKNIFIYNEVNKCDAKAKGFGLVLVGETVNGQNQNVATFTSEMSCCRKSPDKDDDSNFDVSPEELAKKIVDEFCQKIARLGVVDSQFQYLACLLMAMTEQDVSSLTLGPLSSGCVEMLRLIKTFFNLTFRLEYEEVEDDDQMDESSGESEDEEEEDDDADSIDGEKPEKVRINLPKKVSLSCVGMGFSNLVKRRI